MGPLSAGLPASLVCMVTTRTRGKLQLLVSGADEALLKTALFCCLGASQAAAGGRWQECTSILWVNADTTAAAESGAGQAVRSFWIQFGAMRAVRWEPAGGHLAEAAAIVDLHPHQPLQLNRPDDVALWCALPSASIMHASPPAGRAFQSPPEGVGGPVSPLRDGHSPAMCTQRGRCLAGSRSRASQTACHMATCTTPRRPTASSVPR